MTSILLLDDASFATFIMLRRDKLQHDSWYELSDLKGILSHITSTKEYLEKNPAFSTPLLVHPEHDLVIDFDINVLNRAFQIFVDHPPTNEDLEYFNSQSRFSLGSICIRLCWDPIFLRKIYSPVVSHWTQTDYVREFSTYANFLAQDCFHKSGWDRLRSKKNLTQRLKFLQEKPLSIEIVFYNDVAADRHLLIDKIQKSFGRSDVEISFCSEDEISENGFKKETSLFITNNNFIYRSLSKIHELLEQRPEIISACWLFDNHHQFGVSNQISDSFDFVFPAHPTGVLYLIGGKAVVGPVVPCGIIQWSTDQVKEFYNVSKSRARSNSLYGRFNSYNGRTVARDRFLTEAARVIDNNSLKIIRYDQQDWYDKGNLGRFLDFSDYKVSLSVPIFNDVPIRIFDALAAGQIPLVPFGVPGFEVAVPFDTQKELPILTYFYDDTDSLREAYLKAVDIFDQSGQIGADLRHAYAIENHMGHHRLASIITWIVGWPGGSNCVEP